MISVMNVDPVLERYGPPATVPLPPHVRRPGSVGITESG